MTKRKAPTKTSSTKKKTSEDTLLEEMYDARGIQLATEETWRELDISVNLERRLKEALHPYQKERRQAVVTEGYLNSKVKALQALEAMKRFN